MYTHKKYLHLLNYFGALFYAKASTKQSNQIVFLYKLVENRAAQMATDCLFACLQKSRLSTKVVEVKE